MANKKIELETLQKEYQTVYSKYESFCSEAIHQLSHLLQVLDIKLAFPIQYRTKLWSSILNKVEEGRYSIKKSVTELQDLAGIRIILLFQRDVGRVKDIIEKNFDVQKVYNAEERLEENQFGYSSTHIIAQFKEEWCRIPTMAHFKGVKVEIQIRTLSQHSWAEASNILQYKNEQNVPKPLKRSISRISALLETVDLEFERLLTERTAYREEIRENIQENSKDDDTGLDVDILQEALDSLLPAKNKVKNESYSILLSELKALNIDTRDSLSKLVKDNLDYVLDLDKERVKQLLIGNGPNSLKNNQAIKARIDEGAFFSHMGLVRMILRKAFGNDKVNQIQKEKKVT